MAAPTSPGRGRLVVATPDLADPNFDGTVVLLLEHGPEGALGVVLNRASELSLTEAMSGPPTAEGLNWEDVADDPPVVFVGGPVRPNAIIALAVVPEVRDPERWEPIAGPLGVVNIGDGPLGEVGDLRSLRVFAGYAGWGAGQLEDEVGEGSWFVVDARPEDCFSADPERLWRRVLRRQGGVFTTVTDNPVLN